LEALVESIACVRGLAGLPAALEQALRDLEADAREALEAAEGRGAGPSDPEDWIWEEDRPERRTVATRQ